MVDGVAPSPDPLVGDEGSWRKQRQIDVRVDSDPGPPGFVNGPWVRVHGGCITGADVAAWPKSVGMLRKFTTFFCVLCTGLLALRVWGVLVFLIWRFMILFEQWAAIALFPFLLFLCQKELKFGNVASLSVAWAELWESFLVGLVGFYPARGFYPVRLVGICPGYGTSVGTSVPMV